MITRFITIAQNRPIEVFEDLVGVTALIGLVIAGLSVPSLF